MLAQEIIRIKRDGGTLTAAQIRAFVEGLTQNTWSEGQAASMAMAIFMKGMSSDESIALTQSMMMSGDVMDWSSEHLNGPILDKHSTGGVGDKVSLMLAPMVAACGGFVPMISGRGLGHTGGTLDKFDSIPGYTTAPTLTQLRQTLKTVGCAIIGQTANLAPADKRLYAIRDVTATVESIPLITASILSKKLAAGLQGLVMDVKVGNGAFASTMPMARELATSLTNVANGAGLPTHAIITDMNQVLGHSCGNAVEMFEAIEFLQNGYQETRLREVTLALGAQMLLLGKLAHTAQDAMNQLETVLDNGKAADHFARMIHSLGGPVNFMEKASSYLPRANIKLPVYAPCDGWIQGMATRDIGLTVIALGGGRRVAGDPIDHSVGFTRMSCVGTSLKKGELLAYVHAATSEQAQTASQCLLQAIQISDTQVKKESAIMSHGSMQEHAHG